MTNVRLPLAVILGASPTGLGVARDLGRKRVPVSMFDFEGTRVGHFSRYCMRHGSQNAVRSEPELIHRLEALGRCQIRKPVLFPTSDAMVCTVARHRERLEPYYCVPDSLRAEQTNVFVDKRQFYVTCCAHRAVAPKTAFANSPADLEECTSGFSFPLLLKPALAHLWREQLQGDKLLVVRSKDELRAVVERFGAQSAEMMVQELIPGPEDNIWVAGIYIRPDGRCGACFVGRKIRQHPPGFGSASLAESRSNPVIAERSLQFLQAIGFRGVCGTEFKFDPRDGQYKLIEVNQRQTLWFALIGASGVDLNYIAYCDLAGLPCAEPHRQVDGVRWAYLEKDVLTSVRYVLERKLTLSQWLGSLRHIKSHAVMSLSDPLPALAQARYLIARGLSRLCSASPTQD